MLCQHPKFDARTDVAKARQSWSRQVEESKLYYMYMIDCTSTSLTKILVVRFLVSFQIQEAVAIPQRGATTRAAGRDARLTVTHQQVPDRQRRSRKASVTRQSWASRVTCQKYRSNVHVM